MASDRVNWIVAIIITIVSGLLSWPFATNHSFWAESQGMWFVHVGVGLAMGLYVAYIFTYVLRTLVYEEAECCKPVEERKRPILHEDR